MGSWGVESCGLSGGVLLLSPIACVSVTWSVGWKSILSASSSSSSSSESESESESFSSRGLLEGDEGRERLVVAGWREWAAEDGREGFSEFAGLLAWRKASRLFWPGLEEDMKP